jgi:hypothetical protein
MLLEIVALIMLIIGAIGGLVHWLLPANINENNKPINPCWKCILLGIGATMLVPFIFRDSPKQAAYRRTLQSLEL